MTRKLEIIEEDGRSEVKKHDRVKQNRENMVKRPNMDVEDLKVQTRGFVAFHWKVLQYKFDKKKRS